MNDSGFPWALALILLGLALVLYEGTNLLSSLGGFFTGNSGSSSSSGNVSLWVAILAVMAVFIFI